MVVSTATRETVELVQAQRGTAVAVPGSVTGRGFTDDLVAAAVETCGGLDIVVNNAGYTWDWVIQKTRTSNGRRCWTFTSPPRSGCSAQRRR